MCELMALSLSQPLSTDFAIGPFGGRGADNPHGWGLAWYPDQSLALVKEPVSWQASPHTAFLQTYPGLRSRIYLAHVRHKTSGGEPTHADTHPFARELRGRDYCFVHNGTLEGVFEGLRLGRFRPVGATDSEHLFCHLLEELDQAQGSLTTPASWHWLHGQLQAANRLGQLNCLLADGERLFCYHDAAGYKGLHLGRVPEKARPFVDADLRVAVSVSGRETGYAIATRPFHERGWEAFRPGELMVFAAGALCFSSHRESEASSCS
jgi:predicted glutamine amidotransferase